MLFKLAHRAASLLVLPILATSAVVALSATESQAAPTLAAQVVSLTNQQRAKHGCPNVRMNAALVKAAGNHSRDMATRGYFSHTSPTGSTFVQRAKAAGYNFALSENIAYGYRTPSTVMTGWMKSPGHRANILNCKAKAVGVGVVASPKGVFYWTQVFGRV